MTALTANRLTKNYAGSGVGRQTSFPVASGVKVYQGALLVLNSNGEVAPATTATGLTPIGRSDGEYPLSTIAGEFLVDTRIGVFNYISGGGADTIAIKDRGKFCYIIDDQTVGLTSGGGTRSVAGVVFDVTSDGVWVDLFFPSSGIQAFVAGTGGTPLIVKDEGSTVEPNTTTLDFIGGNVTAASGGAGIVNVTVAGSGGDVLGPASSTAGQLPTFSGTKVLQNSPITVAQASGNITGAGTYNGKTVDGTGDSRPPSGAATGDLGGTYPAPSVATVGGSTAAAVSSHVTAVTGNPHAVTAAQAGAIANAATFGGDVSGVYTNITVDKVDGAGKITILRAAAALANDSLVFGAGANRTTKILPGYQVAAGRLEVPALHTSTETVNGTVAAGVIKAARGNLFIARSDSVEPTRFVSLFGPQGAFTAWNATLPAVGPSLVGQGLRIGSLTAGSGGGPDLDFDYMTMFPTTAHAPAGTAVTLVANRVNLIDTSSATGAVTATLPANAALVEGDWLYVRVTDSTRQVTIAAGAGSTLNATAAEKTFSAASEDRTLGVAYAKGSATWEAVSNTNKGGSGALNTYVVGPVGSGAPFTSIQAAINQAVADGHTTVANGATILVLAGVYIENIIITTDGIAVCGFGVRLSSSTGASATVEGSVTFSGGTVWWRQLGIKNTTGVAVTVTSGSVGLVDSPVSGFGAANVSGGLLSVDRGVWQNTSSGVPCVTVSAGTMIGYRLVMNHPGNGANGFVITGGSMFLAEHAKCNGQVVTSGSGGFRSQPGGRMSAIGVPVLSHGSTATVKLENVSIDCTVSPAITGTGPVTIGAIYYTGAGRGVSGVTLTGLTSWLGGFITSDGSSPAALGTPSSGAAAEVQSVVGGFAGPRMTTAQRVAIVSPATGLEVYDTDLNSKLVYNGTAWIIPTNFPSVTATPAATSVALVKNRVNLIDTSSATGDVTAKLPANAGLTDGDWIYVRVTDSTRKVTIAAGAGSTLNMTAAEKTFAAASADRTVSIAYAKGATVWEAVGNTGDTATAPLISLERSGTAPVGAVVFDTTIKNTSASVFTFNSGPGTVTVNETATYRVHVESNLQALAGANKVAITGITGQGTIEAVADTVGAAQENKTVSTTWVGDITAGDTVAATLTGSTGLLTRMQIEKL